MDEHNILTSEEFEKEWIEVAEEVVKRLMSDSNIQRIKEKVRSQGRIALEDRNEFIDLVNKIKYSLIYERYGAAGTDSYARFAKAWERWQRERGPARPQGENMFEDNINHLLYGSTPDPNMFLRDFDLNKDIT